MITIAQLLESVDLDFEPRFVTKDEDGTIYIWGDKPEIEENIWDAPLRINGTGFGAIKLTEFYNKKWQECIYEVPQIDKQNLEKLRPADSDLVYRVKLPRKTTGKIEPIYVPRGEDFAGSGVYAIELAKRLNQVIDAVNELRGKMNVV